MKTATSSGLEVFRSRGLAFSETRVAWNHLTKRFADDLVGRAFGNLVVLARIRPAQGKNTKWICRCFCGSFCAVARGSLLDGKTRSCGCQMLSGRWKKRMSFKPLPPPPYDFRYRMQMAAIARLQSEIHQIECHISTLQKLSVRPRSSRAIACQQNLREVMLGQLLNRPG